MGEKSGSRANADPMPRGPSASGKRPTRAAPVANAGAESRSITITHSPVSSDLDLAYNALIEGRFDDARAAYRKCLERNPNERDALLGLAYIAHRQGSNEEAGDLYQRVLRLEPNNPTANAGLVSLGLDGDVARTASRARDFAEQTPESAVALATVGAAFVREGRIAEAQQAFFKALALEPENPVHAYNLAVALDRLHKYGPALTYYVRALQLAESSSAASKAGIPLSQARQRVQELQQAATPKPAPQAPSR